MPLQIHTNAIQVLRNMKNPSFVIFELKNNLLVDFAESENEAFDKCKIAEKYGSGCKYYETSVTTIDDIREATKDIDVTNPMQGVKIEGIDMGFFES